MVVISFIKNKTGNACIISTDNLAVNISYNHALLDSSMLEENLCACKDVKQDGINVTKLIRILIIIPKKRVEAVRFLVSFGAIVKA